MMMRRIIFTLGVMALLAGCSSNKLPSDLDADERMKAAVEFFEKGKYFDAKTQFRILTLSYGGTTVADKAQFYLAECHFNLKEYILSAAEYERLIKLYPSSQYVDDAKYKLGLSYFELSPKYSLDQEYTQLAIQHFQEFLEEYHNSDLVSQVEKMLLETRNKLAHKKYSSAEQYRKMGEYRAAIIYYNMVLSDYYDTEYAAKAQYYVGECYRKQKEYSDSVREFALFIDKYPKHEWFPDAQEKLKQVERELQEAKEEQETVTVQEKLVEK